MILQLQGTQIEPPLIQQAIVETIEVATPKQTDEKEEIKTITWRDNPQGCDESTEYIAEEEPFYCIPKPIERVESVVTARTTNSSTPARKASASAPALSWWAYGNCTWYVASKRPVGYWNDASSWYWQAQRDGWATGTTPRVGAIAWEPGHVSYVESVNGDGTVTVSEYNYSVSLGYGTRTVPATQLKYIY